MRKCACILLVASIAGFLVGCGNRDETTRAKRFVDSLGKSDFSGAVENFDDTMKAAMPPEKLQAAWDQVIAQVGPFKERGATRTEESAGYKVVIVTCRFEKATMDIKVVFNSKKQISGLWMLPSQAPAGS